MAHIFYIGEFDPPTISDQNALKELLKIKEYKNLEVTVIPINEERKTDKTIKADDIIRNMYCSIAFSFHPKISHYRYYASKKEVPTINRIKSYASFLDYNSDKTNMDGVEEDIIIYISQRTAQKYSYIFNNSYFKRFHFITYGNEPSKYYKNTMIKPVDEETIDQIDLRNLISNGDEEAYKYLPDLIIGMLEDDNVYNPELNKDSIMDDDVEELALSINI